MGIKEVKRQFLMSTTKRQVVNFSDYRLLLPVLAGSLEEMLDLNDVFFW